MMMKIFPSTSSGLILFPENSFSNIFTTEVLTVETWAVSWSVLGPPPPVTYGKLDVPGMSSFRKGSQINDVPSGETMSTSHRRAGQSKVSGVC